MAVRHIAFLQYNDTAATEAAVACI